MTDSNESRISATEDDGADFEGHKVHDPEKISKMSDQLATADDDSPDFEGHGVASPEKIAKMSDKIT